MATEKKGTKPVESKKTCFIIMPITTPKHLVETYGGDTDHFVHVLNSLFIPAVDKAGFDPIPPEVVGTEIIQAKIFENLENADLVLCDISALNANVFFELGIRTARNKPVCMIRDEHAKIPFDTSSLSCPKYSSKLNGWEMDDQREALTKHIQATAKSKSKDNPIWRHYSLSLAELVEPSPGENGKIEVLTELVKSLQSKVDRIPNIEIGDFDLPESTHHQLFKKNNTEWISGYNNKLNKMDDELESDIYMYLKTYKAKVIQTEFNARSKIATVWIDKPLAYTLKNALIARAKDYGWLLNIKVAYNLK